MSEVKSYVTHGPSASHRETLLRVSGAHAGGVFDIARGKKVLARVRVIEVKPGLEIIWGQVNLESAKDAIFIHDLEKLQARREREKAPPSPEAVVAEALKSRPTNTPQVLVSMSPSGELFIELPSHAGRRKIELRHGDAEETLKRVLIEQREGNIAIGQDGAPTEAQVRHWERHQVFADERCAFCASEGRLRRKLGAKRRARAEIISKSKGVEIRRLVAKVKTRRGEKTKVKVITNRSLEDLGL